MVSLLNTKYCKNSMQFNFFSFRRDSSIGEKKNRELRIISRFDRLLAKVSLVCVAKKHFTQIGRYFAMSLDFRLDVMRANSNWNAENPKGSALQISFS